MANVNIQLGYKDSTWFTTNATLVLLAGQVVYLQQTGQYKIGDGTTQLQNLVFQGLAQETQLVTATVVNKTGVNLLASNYQAVKVSTAQGQRLAVDFAQANNDNNSADTIGLVKENININQEGNVVILGQITEINTTGSLQGETWTDGDVIYLSPTTAGSLTNVKPTGLTGHIVVIGYVEYAHAVHGKIYTKIANGFELDELHNTYINQTTLSNNDLLTYESSSQLWKNNNILKILGYTPANQNGTVLYHSVKWFTPSGNISSLGNIVTSIGAQFTSAMVGAKLIINNEERIITTYNSTNQVTVTSAYSINYSGIIPLNWGVYSKFLELLNNGDENEYNYLNTRVKWMHSGGGIFYFSDFGHGNDIWRLRSDGLWNGFNSIINWGAVGSLSTRDIGIRRNNSGVLEIFDGTNTTGLLTNRRDLLVRNIKASSLTINSSPFNITGSNNTGQTASTEINGFNYENYSRQWNNGTISLQREHYYRSTTYSFTLASTITDAYEVYIESPTAGTNATITNNYSLGTSGKAKFGGNIELTQTVTTETVTSDTTVTIKINGVNYKLLAKS